MLNTVTLVYNAVQRAETKKKNKSGGGSVAIEVQP